MTETHPHDHYRVKRLTLAKLTIAAVVLGVLVQTICFPFFFAGATIGLSGTAMLWRFVVDLLIQCAVLSMLMASRRCLGRVLLSAAVFSIVYMISTRLTLAVLLEPGWEAGVAFGNGLAQAFVGVVDGVTVLALAIVPAMFLAKLFLRSRSIRAIMRRGACWRCGYSLAGLPDALRCPECNAERETGWPNRVIAAIGLGHSTRSRRIGYAITSLALMVSVGAMVRLIHAESTATPGAQIEAAFPCHFAERAGASAPTPRLGMAIDVSDQFGIADPYQLLLIISPQEEFPPRAQLLLMHLTRGAFLGVVGKGIAFGELRQTEAADIRAGGSPTRVLDAVAQFMASHAGGRRISGTEELWEPPPQDP